MIYYAITDKTDDVSKNKVVYGTDQIRKDETPRLDKEKCSQERKSKNLARQCTEYRRQVKVWKQ